MEACDAGRGCICGAGYHVGEPGLFLRIWSLLVTLQDTIQYTARNTTASLFHAIRRVVEISWPSFLLPHPSPNGPITASRLQAAMS